MEEDTSGFCAHCGHYLKDGERFCPECGTRVPAADPEEAARERAEVKEAVGRQLRWASIILLVYSIPFLALGIAFLLFSDGIADYVFSDGAFDSYIEYYGFTQDEVRTYLQYSALAFLASGLCGIASAALCWKRTRYWLAVVLCILSVFAGSTGLLSLFLGLLAFWMVIVSKPAFREYEGRLDEELSRIFREG
ncbi:MAG: zinc ribbon domain-containing protein [Thermoplasmata archaeon]|nr:zinc ribbon domain-containing protein [Thermoplasmata archaeon]